jgi:molecular chaperone GrpE
VTDNVVNIRKEDEKKTDMTMHEEIVPVEKPTVDEATTEALVAEAVDEGQKPTAAPVTGRPAMEEAIAAQVPSEAETEDEVTRLRRQLQAKEQEAKDHYEARLRIQAEFENYRKRQEKELGNFRKYAHENVIREIIPIVDDFERAIGAAEQTHNLEDFLKGVELIFSKLLDALQKKGVKEIEAAKGQPFNPEIHEAVMQMETDDVAEGTIAQVFEKGYYLYERVIRAPKVGVAKKREG